MTDTLSARKLKFDRPGVDRFIDIADALDREKEFWSSVDAALDRVGLSSAYVSAFTLKADKHRLKYIKDSVWGMLEFSREEMALIDSPVVQRLRGIKQNGFTYLTYPSAEHSRFSHTLGVAHVTKRLLLSINEVAQRQPTFSAGGQDLSSFNISSRPELVASLIHAAILHDIGHFAFSHASEMAFNLNADRLSFGSTPITKVVDLFRKFQIESDLAELMSIIICLSPRFREFYRKVIPEQDGKAIFRICCFISGVSHDHGFPGLANIVSGAVVDADKIDYINRDALHCGLPAGIDVARIFLNSSLVDIDEKHAAKIGANTRQGMQGGALSPGVHFIVNSAGIDTYDEISTSRSVLYHRVYLHPAARNAEQLFAECISRMCSLGSKAQAPLVNVLDYFPYKDQQLLDKLDETKDSSQLSRRLVARSLPKRAFIIFRDVCEPFIKLSDLFGALRDGDGHNRGSIDQDTALLRSSAWRIWSSLVPDDPIEAPRLRAALTRRISELAVELRELVDRKFDRNALSRSEPLVGFAPRVMLKPAPEVLVREKNSIGRSVHWTKSEELTTAENIFKAADYIFADSEWLPYVRPATMRAIFEFGQSLSSHVIDDNSDAVFDFEKAEFEVMPTLDFILEDIAGRLGFDYADLVKEASRAADVGFFEDAFRLVPLDAAQERHCDLILSKYSSFSGERGWRLSRRSVVNYVRQFPVKLRDEVIELLLGGDILRREHFSSGILGAVRQQLNESRKIIFARFSPNSGNLTGMLLEQDARDSLSKQGHEFCRNISDVERCLSDEQKKNLVFVDDQFATGSQACAQLYHWANPDRSSWPEEYQRESNIDLGPPGPNLIEQLKSGAIFLTFLYGSKAGMEKIETVAKSLGFFGVSVSYDEELPSKSALVSSELRAFLEDVGMHVLQHCSKEKRGLETYKSDALGYGGVASLMVTPFNVPSHTITAIWCPGKYKSLPWVPLMLRRGYRKHLVIG